MALSTFGERDLVQAICAFRLFSQEVELSLSTRESAALPQPRLPPRHHRDERGFAHQPGGTQRTGVA